jgi:CO/xanthine dehydrogenase FAD-binding subunit
MKGMMELKIKEYVKVNSIEEAYELQKANPKNLVVGGGAWLKQTNKEVDMLIDLELLGLNKIEDSEKEITIGAYTTLRDIEQSELLNDLADGIFTEAVRGIMGVSIRNIATIGGSIMGKYSFSDVLTPLLVLDVTLEFYKRGKISLVEFMSIKKVDDILLNVIINKKETLGYFYTMKKTKLDLAVVNVAVSNGDGINIAIGARPSVASLPTKAIEFINNQKVITKEVINETAKLAVEETKFGTNSRASEEYRRSITETYIIRGLSEVLSV